MRNRSLDIAKGIAICLMVLGHSFSNDNAVLWLINSFHMPFFFIVSGVLYAVKFQNGVSFHIGKMAQKLLIPYAVFDILFCVYFAVFNRGDTVIALLKERLYYTATLEGNNATWFLACMFVTEVLFFVVLKYVKKKELCILLFAVLAIFGFVYTPAWLPMVLKRSMLYLGYLAIGYYAKEIFVKNANVVIVITTAISFVALAIVKNMWQIPWIMPLMNVLTGVSGSFVLLQVSKWICKIKVSTVLDFFGQNTLIVLCVHIFVIEALRLVDYKVFNSILPKLGIAEGFVLSTIVLLCMAILIPLCNRYACFLFGKRRKVKKLDEV